MSRQTSLTQATVSILQAIIPKVEIIISVETMEESKEISFKI
jgi:hypothetical protein